MSIWTVALMICWLDGAALDCHTWAGGPWPSVAACTKAVNSMVALSGAAYFLAKCSRRVAT